MAAKPVKQVVSVRVDEEFRTSLEVFTKAGISPSDAIKYCVNILSVSVNTAWENEYYPKGVLPMFGDIVVVPYTS